MVLIQPKSIVLLSKAANKYDITSCYEVNNLSNNYFQAYPDVEKFDIY